MEQFDKLNEACIKRFGHTSLYTWMRNNISDRITRRRNQLVSISLLREDGYNISYDIINDNYQNSQYDDIYNKKISYRVEDAINAIKTARMHERILLYIRCTGLDISNNTFDDYEMYLLIRFGDKSYMHPVHGPKVKQIISAEQIAPNYFKDYVNHFTISGKVTNIVKNPNLLSIISFNKIDNEKFSNLKEHLNDSTIVDEIERSLIEIRHLNVMYNALSDTEKETLMSLPFLGHPNYTVTHDLRLKIYVKSSTNESFGNGNAISFYSDSTDI